MNNPFYYEPDALSRKAVNELVDWLYGKASAFSSHPVSKDFRNEIDKGKMFGVLVVKKPGIPSPLDYAIDAPFSHPLEGARGRLLFLAAYSGQICGRSDWQGFVPAVFDYLQPDGYFKQHEAEITDINLSIQNSESKIQNSKHHEVSCNHKDLRPVFDKKQRDDESDEEYIKRRQYENAELHRWKLRERKRKEEADAVERQKEDKIRSLKTLRRQKSDDLQRWLFSHFIMKNGKGEERNLLDINTDFYKGSRPLPPAGSGECCEPKLLQCAFTHSLKPISMAMFWWGESPKNEVRHHLHFYPACNNKCKPILKWMLQGIDVAPNPLESKESDARLASQIKTIYEDADICVISKPAGLISVPGKNGRESVLSVMRRRYPDSDSPLIVHRLDMDTSGLMIIAKSMTAYHTLQQQFAKHEVRKRYVAILSTPLPLSRKPLHSNGTSAPTGTISLPLRPDLDDRPRQVVDFEYGKPAVTFYRFVDKQRVWLWPQTGRTHQLRVHCAHKLGLGNPIMGDRLYGDDNNLSDVNGRSTTSRLCLHAEEITFIHPTNGRKMTFTDKAPF